MINKKNIWALLLIPTLSGNVIAYKSDDISSDPNSYDENCTFCKDSKSHFEQYLKQQNQDTTSSDIYYKNCISFYETYKDDVIVHRLQDKFRSIDRGLLNNMKKATNINNLTDISQEPRTRDSKKIQLFRYRKKLLIKINQITSFQEWMKQVKSYTKYHPVNKPYVITANI